MIVSEGTFGLPQSSPTFKPVHAAACFSRCSRSAARVWRLIMPRRGLSDFVTHRLVDSNQEYCTQHLYREDDTGKLPMTDSAALAQHCAQQSKRYRASPHEAEAQ